MSEKLAGLYIEHLFEVGVEMLCFAHLQFSQKSPHAKEICHYDQPVSCLPDLLPDRVFFSLLTINSNGFREFLFAAESISIYFRTDPRAKEMSA